MNQVQMGQLQANAWGLQLEWIKVVDETLLLPVLLYGRDNYIHRGNVLD